MELAILCIAVWVIFSPFAALIACKMFGYRLRDPRLPTPENEEIAIRAMRGQGWRVDRDEFDGQKTWTRVHLGSDNTESRFGE